MKPKKSENPWIAHVKKWREKHPKEKSYKKALQEAKKTYKKKSKK